MVNKKLLAVRLVLGMGILVFLLYKVDIIKLLDVLKRLTFWAVVLFLAVSPIMLFMSTFNIYIMLRAVGVRMNFLQLLYKAIFSRAAGFFLPGKLGELSLVYLLKNEAPYGVSAPAILLDKIITFIVLVGFASIGFFDFFTPNVALNLILFFVGILGGVLFVVLHKRTRLYIRRYVLHRYAHHFSGFGRTTDYLVKERRGVLLANFAITAVLWMSIGFIIKLIFLQFEYHLPIMLITSIHSIGVLSSFIPVSISGIGVRESLVTYLYQHLGVNTAVVASIYLLFLFFSSLAASGALFFVHKPIDEKK